MGSMVLDATYSEIVGSRPAHFHDCHQLLYIRGGHAKITVQGRHYLAEPGSAILISRFEEHAIEVSGDIYCRYALHISPTSHSLAALREEPYLSVLVNRPSQFRHVVSLRNREQAESLLDQILREQETQRPMYRKMQELLLQQLLLGLCREHPELLAQQKEQIHLVQAIQAQFESDYAKPISLGELAQQYHLSPSHISHLFKAVTGSSVMRYLTDCRLAAAKRYLAETDLEIGAIVEACGFSDNSNFSRMFRSVTGMSPTHFRRQYQ